MFDKKKRFIIPKKLQKLLRVLTALLICFSLTGNNIVNADAVDCSERTNYYYSVRNKAGVLSSARLTHKMYNGRQAYCVEPGIMISYDDVYASQAVADWNAVDATGKETIILASAFGQGYAGRNDTVYYAAAQSIIWKEVGATYVDWGSNDSSVKAAEQEIRASIDNYRKTPDFVIHDMTDNVDLVSTGNDVHADITAKRLYKITDRNHALSSYQQVEKNNIVFLNENNQEVNPTETDGVFYVRCDRADVQGRASFQSEIYTTRFANVPIMLYGNEKKPDAQKLIVSGDVSVKKASISLSVKDRPFTFEKVDENGNSMSGALIHASTNGQQVSEWTTDGSGHPINLQVGNTYTFSETDAPDGYYCKEATYTITADSFPDDRIVMTNDDKILYQVLKEDENGQCVKGAELALYDITNGDAVLVEMKDAYGNPWITDGNPRSIGSYLHVGHSYAIVENNASTKYYLAENLNFTVPYHAPSDNKMTDLKVVDNHITYRFAKVDEKGDPVEKAELVILDVSDNNREVYRFTTGIEPAVTGQLERGHTYRLIENRTPDGRYTMEEKLFTVPDYHDDSVITITAQDNSIIYLADKVDENGVPVAGAQMELYDITDGKKLIQTFVTTEASERLTGMIIGHTYLLHETKAPTGHYLAEDVSFQIPEHGTSEPVHIQAIDNNIFYKVRKTDTDGNPLADIVLEIIDKETGKPVGSWKTLPDQDIEVGYLLDEGKTYILKETETINGFYQSDDIEFTVQKNQNPSEIPSVTMKDAPIRYAVKKTDEDGNLLAGAHLQLLETDSETVLDEWDSITDVHDISSLLHAGHSYRIRETFSPDGYYRSSEVSFTVPLKPEKDELVTIAMVDHPVRYEVCKLDDTGKPVAGVHLQVKDKESGTLIEEWDTDDKPHALSSLIAGRTYILLETEWINGIHQAAEIQFTVPLEGNGSTSLINMVDETVALSFLKTDEKGTPLAGAELSVLDMSGNLICSLISDEESTGVFKDTEGREISSLLKGGETYILHEEKAPHGYEKAEDVTFTVTGTMAQPQCIVMSDKPADVFIRIHKADADHINHSLSNCEVKVYYNSTQQPVTDDTGKELVLTTDKDGYAEFVLPYTKEGYYVKETKAPEGYTINNETFHIRAEEEQGFVKEDPLPVEILDTAEVDTGTSIIRRMTWMEWMGAFMCSLIVCVCLNRKTNM